MRSRSTGTCRSAASPRLLIVVLRVGGGCACVRRVAVRAVGGAGAGAVGVLVVVGRSTRRLVPIRSGPARGKSRREAGRLEAGGRVVGRSGWWCGGARGRARRPGASEARDHLLRTARSRRSRRA